MPQRYQRRRRAGARPPPAGTVYVGRSRKDWPGPWGNPFRLQHTHRRWKSAQLAEVAVLLYEAAYADDAAFQARVRAALHGKNLSCWCPLGAPCHGDVLLAWANSPSPRLDCC